MTKKLVPFHIRNMELKDKEEVLPLLYRVHGFTGTYTMDSIIAYDPDGVIVAVHDETNEILGVICGVLLTPELSFVSRYGVLPEYQGDGIGKALWEKLMSHIGHSNVTLGCLPELLPIYRDKRGFTHMHPAGRLCYSGKPLTDKLFKHIPGIKINPIDDTNIDAVIDYDTEVSSISRGDLLRLLFKEVDSMNFVAMDEKSNNKVVGIIGARNSNFGWAMCGPIYADSPAIAELLLDTIIDNFPIATTNGMMFVPYDTNSDALEMGDRVGLQCAVGGGPWYIVSSKKVFHGDSKRIYGMYPNCGPN